MYTVLFNKMFYPTLWEKNDNQITQIKDESEVMGGLARIDGDLYEDIFFCQIYVISLFMDARKFIDTKFNTCSPRSTTQWLSNISMMDRKIDKSNKYYDKFDSNFAALIFFQDIKGNPRHGMLFTLVLCITTHIWRNITLPLWPVVFYILVETVLVS